MARIEYVIASHLKHLSEEFAEYGAIIDKVRLVKDNREGTTMWVNPHCEMGYNEKFCSRLKDTELKAVVLHELRHIEYGHFVRENAIRKIYGNHYSHDIHNIAEDLEINSKILNLPDFACFPKNFGYPPNLTYEEYFQKLIKDAKVVDEKGNFKGGGISAPNDVNIGHINSCEGVRNKSSTDGSLSEEDEKFLNDLEVEIIDSVQSRGTGKGNLKGKIKIKPTKPLDILNYIRTQCSNIKNQKTFGYDAINYNSIRSGTIPRIVTFNTYTELVTVILSFIIDVSGSRSDKQINESISRIWSTLESVDDIDFVMDLYFADDDVTQVNRVTKRSDIPTAFSGRGGTYLSKAYKRFEIEYDLIIVLTDGYIDWRDINALEPKFKSKTVIGIDKESYLTTYNKTDLPTFVL